MRSTWTPTRSRRASASSAASIAADYAGRDLLLVIVLRGAVVFGSDLSRATAIPHALDFVSVAGYASPFGDGSSVRLLKDLDEPISGRNVVVVENVVDTGLSLNYILKALALRDPASLAVCTLIDRPYRRLVDDLPIRYAGFTAPGRVLRGLRLRPGRPLPRPARAARAAALVLHSRLRAELRESVTSGLGTRASGRTRTRGWGESHPPPTETVPAKSARV